jgi:hypothetical protein
MGRLVLATGVPHPPRLVREVADAPGQLRSERLMSQVQQQAKAAAPDVIIKVDDEGRPGGTIQEFPLSGEGMEALISGDVGALYRIGVHIFF